MSPTSYVKITTLLILCHAAASAQVSPTAPKHWKTASPVGLNSSDFMFDHKLREAVRGELLDTNTVCSIAKSVEVTEHEQTLFQVAPGPVEEEVWLYQLSNEWGVRCDRFAARLGEYVLARMDGHTSECLLTGIANRQSLSSISDPDLLIVATNYPILPVLWFKKAQSGTTTNKAGQVKSRSIHMTMVDGKEHWRTNTDIPQVDELCRWVSYTLVDGSIAWRYLLRFKLDGSLEDIDVSKVDAKELDPKFQTAFKEVDSEVEAEMKQRGTYGRFGSVHTYWGLKKEKLKARGINWRSPNELNRNTSYD